MYNKLKFLIAGLKSVNSIKKAYHNNFKTTPYPIALHFETTYVCTCKCAFCDRWIDGPSKIQQELTYDEITDMIDQAYDLGVRIITLSGGEPLVKKDILKAMLYARKKGMITNTTHNGTLVNEKNVHEILRAFDVINISLDSLNREKHDEIRGVKGTYDKAMRTIKLLKKYSRNTTIQIQSVLTSENQKDLIKINKKFSKKGINTYFQPIHDGLDNDFKVSKQKFKNFDLKQLKDDHKLLVQNYVYPNLLTKLAFKKYYEKSLDFIIDNNSTKKCFNCFGGSMSFFINPYGEVYPCDPLRISMGNIKDRPLVSIWKDKKSAEIRKQIKNRNCNCWLLCSAPAFMNLSKIIK